MDIDDIKNLVLAYRHAEESEEWDEFMEDHGDVEELCDTLIMIIEDKLL